jgi:hypothetical protein
MWTNTTYSTNYKIMQHSPNLQLRPASSETLDHTSVENIVQVIEAAIKGVLTSTKDFSLAIFEVPLKMHKIVASSFSPESKGPQLMPVTLDELFGTRRTNFV